MQNRDCSDQMQESIVHGQHCNNSQHDVHPVTAQILEKEFAWIAMKFVEWVGAV